jgi:hypothetical protein
MALPLRFKRFFEAQRPPSSAEEFPEVAVFSQDIEELLSGLERY